jgi:hypothetical protein
MRSLMMIALAALVPVAMHAALNDSRRLSGGCQKESSRVSRQVDVTALHGRHSSSTRAGRILRLAVTMILELVIDCLPLRLLLGTGKDTTRLGLRTHQQLERGGSA